MRRACLTFAMVWIAAACLAAQESSAGPQQRASVSSGERTVVGCIAIGAPSGYVLKTDDGNIINLRNIGSDLSAYVGKRVEIRTTWSSTGVVVSTPLETTTGAAPAAAGGAKPATDFAGDIHLRLKGKVLGDCLGKK